MFTSNESHNRHRILYKGTSVTAITFFKIKDTVEMAKRGMTATTATIDKMKRGGQGNGYSREKWSEIIREDLDCEVPNRASANEIEKVRCVGCTKNLKVVDERGLLQIGFWFGHKLSCAQLQCVLNATTSLNVTVKLKF